MVRTGSTPAPDREDIEEGIQDHHVIVQQVAVDAITVEHNFEEPKRTQIRDLLASHGFVLETAMKWDDWYVRRICEHPTLQGL
jgi:hypothetical protein